MQPGKKITKQDPLSPFEPRRSPAQSSTSLNDIYFRLKFDAKIRPESDPNINVTSMLAFRADVAGYNRLGWYSVCLSPVVPVGRPYLTQLLGIYTYSRTK